MKQLKLHKECTHDKLIKFGFKKYGLKYKLFLPLYKYKTHDVIIAEFLVSTIDHYIGYDVIDNNTGTLYFPYYSNDGILNNLVKQKIVKKMDEIFEELNNRNIITEYKKR